MLRAGERFNVISERVELAGTIRTFSKERGDRMMEKLRSELELMRAEGFEYEMRVLQECPPVVNHEQETAHVIRVASGLFGEECITSQLLPTRGTEDFAHYLHHRPGAFFVVTGEDESHSGMVHTANYNFNDRLIPVMLKMWMGLLADRLSFPL